MPPASVWTVETRVSVHDCDFNLRWKPAALFLALLKAASDHAANLGFDYQSMLAEGNAFVLSRFRIHFHAFPQMGDPVTIQTWPKGVQQRLFFTRDFTLHNPRGEALATATSAWLLINPHNRRILLPQVLIDRLPDNRGRSALEMDLEKINPPEGLPERGVFEAGYSAVDVLGHANSARYLEWLSDAIGMQVFSEYQMDWLQLNFVQETRPADQIAVRAGSDGAGPQHWLAEGFNLTSGKRGFEAEFGLRALDS